MLYTAISFIKAANTTFFINTFRIKITKTVFINIDKFL